MKVRVKKTGEIKIVCDFARVQVEDCDSYGNPLEYSLDEVEIIQDEPTFQELKTERDWEQVRINAAIAAMQGMISNSKYYCNYDYGSARKDDTDRCAREAIRYANALIKELKKGG